MTVSPLRRFMLAALLWLPFAFFVWFTFASPLVWPVVQIAKWVLLSGWPRIFLDVIQGADEIGRDGHLLAHHGFWMQVDTNVLYNAAAPGAGARLAYFDFPINPLIYGYCVPLFAGLVMATPLSARWRAAQLAAGLVILSLVQSFGVISEAFKTVGIDLKEGAEAITQLGYSLNLIALCYQFGYLILPPLVPAVLWILFNRAFIEEITRSKSPLRPDASRSAEPNRPRTVETPQPGD